MALSQIEEQMVLDERFKTEDCDDCVKGADGHVAWSDASEIVIFECKDDF